MNFNRLRLIDLTDNYRKRLLLFYKRYFPPKQKPLMPKTELPPISWTREMGGSSYACDYDSVAC